MKIALQVIHARDRCPYRDSSTPDWGPNQPRCEHPNNGPPPVKVLFCEDAKHAQLKRKPFPHKCPLGDFDMSGMGDTITNPIVKQLLDALMVDAALRGSK